MISKIFISVAIFCASYLPASQNIHNVNEILKKYANNPAGWSALNFAIEQRDYSAAIILLDYVRDFNKVDDGFNPLCRVLVNAYETKKLSDQEHLLIDLLIRKGINLKVKSQHCLYRALVLNEDELVIKLLKNGADPHENEGWTLIYAVQTSNYDITKSLLEFGIGSWSRLDLPLHYAVNTLNCEVAKLLLEHGADVQAVGGKILLGIIEHSNYDMANLLIEHGAKVIENPYLPLYYAIKHSNFHLVNLLLERGAIASVGLQCAVEHSNYDMVKLFLERSTDVNASASGILNYALCHSNNEIVRLILDCITDASSCVDALLTAIQNSDLNIVQLLLERGANPNTTFYEKNVVQCVLGIALRNLSNSDSEKIVELLLQYGAKLL